MEKVSDPPDAGQRNRRKRRSVQKWTRRVLLKRRTLMVALWMVKAIVSLLRIIG